MSIILICKFLKVYLFTFYLFQNKVSWKERFFSFQKIKNASLVQLVERWSPKPSVEGSSPSGRDIKNIVLSYLK